MKRCRKIRSFDRIAFDFSLTSLSRVLTPVATVSEQMVDQNYTETETVAEHDFLLVENPNKMVIGRNVELGETTSYVILDVKLGFEGHIWKGTLDIWPFRNQINEEWDWRTEDSIYQIRV